MEALNVPQGVKAPVVEVRYNHKDITAWISPFLESISYVDHLAEADGLEIKVDDRMGKWRSSWYPTKGDTLALALGYEGAALLDCGTFQIDELEVSGPPYTVTLRALSASVKKALRSRTSRRFESQSLAGVVGKFATEHGFTLVGDVPSIQFSALAQDRETDLGFLRRIAEGHGVSFSVRGDLLVFHDLDALEGRQAVVELETEFLEAFSLRDKTREVYQSSEVRYFNAEEKQVIEGTIQAQGKTAGDVLRIRKRAEGTGHAQRLAHAALKSKKGFEQSGTLTMTHGDPRMVAGNLANLGDSFGILSGRYMIQSSRHDVTRSGGYKTECEVRRV